MEAYLALDLKKVAKAYDLTEKKLAYLHKRAAMKTAQNMRAKASKDSLGLKDLRRKKVPRARVKHLTRGTGNI